MTQERTALYRLSGTGEERLYIGVAADPLERWRQHAKERSWWSDVVTMTLEWYETRCEAEAAEAAAIAAERPRYNLRGAAYRGVGMEEVRTNLRELLRLTEGGAHIPITARGRLAGFLLPPADYRQLRAALGDPTDL